MDLKSTELDRNLEVGFDRRTSKHRNKARLSQCNFGSFQRESSADFKLAIRVATVVVDRKKNLD